MLAQPLDHRDRDHVAAALRVLVQVERKRRTRGGRRGEVLEQLVLGEREVGRRDDRDTVCPGRGGVLRERTRLRCRLRPAMDDHPQRPAGRDRQLRGTAPLVLRQQDALARRAQRQHALERARAVELEQGPEGLLVEPLAAITQRRDRRGEGS